MELKIQQLYNKWLENASDDSSLIDELKEIENDEKAIYDRFYRSLEFGTAGLRGVIGAGTNRMNIYNVRVATQGLANYLLNNYENSSVSISYDSRIKSTLFANEAARVLAANGIKVYLSAELQPTPVVSYAVRYFKSHAGIMVTASHNPSKYNGYKCYGYDGCQMTDKAAADVYGEISKLDCFNDVKLVDFDKALADGTIEYIGDEFYESYLSKVEEQSVNKGICEGSGLKVVYTPLNGAGNKLVRKILDRIGVKDVHIVKSQEQPDGNFPTCPYPNPEIKEALEEGLKLCAEVKPDVLLATDPDSDRVGIAIPDGDGYRLVSGNETGIMLTDYILSNRKALGTLPENPIMVKTVVTSVLIERLAKKYGCELRNVLTGFKYIGEQILGLEQKNEEYRYVFGFEESYGYLAGTYVRDKDAVVASMLICEMAAYYKKKGKSLVDVLEGLYKEYGYYKNITLSFEFEGASGMQKMKRIMDGLRNSDMKEIAGYDIVKHADYLLSFEKDFTTGETNEIKLPKSNVLSYSLSGGNAVIVRPSGTEPKIKIYFTGVGTDQQDAERVTKGLIDYVKNSELFFPKDDEDKNDGEN
ncbi:MAG: phospho-sugar mutase [Clostridia bacterium]|nr:phospho-sugar mutase [Clostridia bacterium]